MLLHLRHFVVGVHKHNSLTVGSESESRLVAGDTLVCKGLEDLLEGRLSHTVLLNAKSIFRLLKLTEEPADSLVLLGDSELEEFATLLKDLDAIEVPGQVVKNAEAEGL